MNITYEFIIAQLFGLFALIVLIISFNTKNKKRLLKYQIFSCLLYGLQYLFLKAYTGFLMNIVCMIRNYLFYKSKKKIPIYYLIIIISLIIILGIISYKDIFSLLPISAVILYTIALFKGNTKIIRIFELICCLLYLLYNIKVQAYIGVISTIIEFIGCTILFIKHDIINKETKI